MCMMIYIAADQPLELIKRDEANPDLQVTELIESDEIIRKQFQLPYVYYVGAYEGCGCGFQAGEYPQDDDDERPMKRASLDAFAIYLDKQLKNTKLIELFACWDGNQTVPPEHNRYLTPNMLLSDKFFFLERELSQIKPDIEEISYNELFGIG